jgi:serine/threonine protein kinase
MSYDGNGWASVSEAAQIGIQIVKALEEFHKTGYIHCDLKLDNIMISHEVPKFFVDE